MELHLLYLWSPPPFRTRPQPLNLVKSKKDIFNAVAFDSNPKFIGGVEPSPNI